jgi:uncharacterized membrane protein YvlD (DUF360 family)
LSGVQDIGSGAQEAGVSAVRPLSDRPALRQVVGRGAVITLINGAALIVLAWLMSGFEVDRARDALLAGLVIGVLNAAVWPTIASFVLPLSVLTLGVGSIVVNAVLVGAVLDRMPGVSLDGLWSAVLVTAGLTVMATFAAWALSLDDDRVFDERLARRARRIARGASSSEVPGVVFVQVDGLSESVLRRSLASGDLPTLRRWLTDGTHELVSWTTEWSSQTGVSQCGILHGSVTDMPAFRWLDKVTGEVVVSNRRASAERIEREHSDGNGLLAHDGSSYGNLFSGDASRSALTMSGAGRVKEGRIGAGYGAYFARPSQALRSLNGVVTDVLRERRAAADQRHRKVEPRVERDVAYAFLRAFTTVVSRDVCVSAVLSDVAEGRSVVYVDLLGYDEVSHHSGPDRADTLAVLRDLDRQIGRIERVVAWAPRPYRIVVLSDHGQTQGATFQTRTGETLAEMVQRLIGAASTIDPDSEAGRTESSAWLRDARGGGGAATLVAGAGPTVLASGNLGLVYLPGEPRRLRLEEIEARHPGLIAALRSHPCIGFVLVATEEGSLVLGSAGSVRLSDGLVTGDDPLAPFTAGALDMIRRADGYSNVADIMVNSVYDPLLDEVAAFESQVGSHGGLGGPQNHPFLLRPVDLRRPDGPLDGPCAVHRLFKQWLADLGQPVTTGDPGVAPRTVL